MEIFLCPYELSKSGSGGVQRGTLIKISEDGFWGVADLCPHPALGDKVWEEEVKAEGSLFKRALQLAREDLAARSEGVSLLADKKVLNNILVTDYLTVDLNEDRFDGLTVKIKGDNRVDLLAGILNRITRNLIVRIDFNAKLSEKEFEDFLEAMSLGALKKVEYIEDPTLLNNRWKEWNQKVSLASDWQKTDDPAEAKYRIIKPAREEVHSGSGFCTFTSAMDHPVGVAHGLRYAQKFGQNASGFLTLDLYRPTPFHPYFIAEGAWLNFAESALNDAGIGMTEELNKLTWQPLSKAQL